MDSPTVDLKLPSGRVIVFREPVGRDRRLMLETLAKKYRDEPNGYTRAMVELEQVLPGVVLVSVDGQPPADPDPRARLDGWTETDLAYYYAVFNELTALTREEQADIKEQTKSLRARLRGGN